MPRLLAYLRRFLPQSQPQPLAERLKAFTGALIGIALTGLITHLAVPDAGALPLLIAPMGASAVLLFAVPASPLAQPWSIIGGNIISGLAGVTCVKLVSDPTLAAAAAVSSAILLMSLCRCLHPPGGAVALTTAVGGPAVLAAGYSFVLVPVAMNSVLLLLVALVFNRLSGRSYPHVAHPPPAPDTRVGFTLADIDTALRRYGELLDVSREDLDVLFRQVEVQAHRRLHGEIRCADIMSPAAATTPSSNQPTAREATPIDELLPVLSGGEWREVAIVDADGQSVGVVTQTDLIAALYRARVAEAVAARS